MHCDAPASATAETDAPAPAPAQGQGQGQGQTDTSTSTSGPRPAGSAGKRRGGRNRRKGAGGGSGDDGAGAARGQPPPAQPGTPPAQSGAKAPRGPRPIPPALEQLAALYPQLFGAVFRPLKRGIFQDLVAAHPEGFERDALKLALGIHTRSTRYLQSVAAGQQRHDLQGRPVEAMAPEHVHQALVEVHRRRLGRAGGQHSASPEELLARLRARIVAHIEASGLSREDYAERVRTRDAAANALLDDALADMAAKTAREEALVRAFEASGQSVEAFADMYGMDPRSVSRSLHNARTRAAAAAAAAAAAVQAEPQSRSPESAAGAGAGAVPTAAVPAADADADADAGTQAAVAAEAQAQAGPAAEAPPSGPSAPQP